MSSAVREEPVSPPSTLAALSEPAFRLYFGGQLISVSGTWMQAIAQQVVIYNLTQSDLALGLVTLAQGLPALLLTPFAGVIVERFPRRQILVATQSVMMILAFIQAALQFANSLQVWHIVVLSFCLGLANALDAPARQSFVVDMVGRKQMTSGIVLNSIMFNTARVLGPALGGLALGSVGPAWCFFLNGASFLAVLTSLIIMHVTAQMRPAGRIEIFKPLLEGVRFSRSHIAIRPLLLLAAVTSIFGSTFAVLIPAFADQVLHNTTTGTAALATAQGLGAIVAGIVVAHISRRRMGGKFMTWVAILGAMAEIAFALSTGYVSSLLFITLAGFFMTGQFITMNTLIQAEVPEEFRGRVMSLYTLSFFGLSPISGLIMGAVADRIGTVVAIAVWGTLCLIFNAIILYRSKEVRRLE